MPILNLMPELLEKKTKTNTNVTEACLQLLDHFLYLLQPLGYQGDQLL